MSRKRTELTPAQNADLEARTARGEGAATIHAALGGVISVPTIERRQRELRNPTASKAKSNPAPAPKPEPEAPDPVDVPETIPETATLDTIDRWIKRVEDGARKAEEQGNLAALGSLAMRAASLVEARRKAAPLPKPDPNENPDMKALAAEVEKRLFKLVDDLFAPANPA